MEDGKAEAGAASFGNPQTQIAPRPDNHNWRVLIFGARPKRTLFRVIVWVCLILGLFHNLLLPIQIIGSSMSPTYRNGSLNFVNKLSYASAVPTRWDVVALEADGELLLKRIVGMPGEVVSIRRGEITIDGVVLADEFSRVLVPWEMNPVSLGPEEYFVIGDNRSSSVFGKIRQKQILGKVVF